MVGPALSAPWPLWRVWLGIALILAGLFHGHGHEPSSSDEQFRRQILGTWEDDYQGRRTMILRQDGTGTMIVDLKGWKAALYAKRLQFEMVWSIQNGRLRKKTVGGEPAGKVKAILRMTGDQVEQRITELTTEGLVLLDADGSKRYHWRRVAEPSE